MVTYSFHLYSRSSHHFIQTLHVKGNFTSPMQNIAAQTDHEIALWCELEPSLLNKLKWEKTQKALCLKQYTNLPQSTYINYSLPTAQNTILRNLEGKLTLTKSDRNYLKRSFGYRGGPPME